MGRLQLSLLVMSLLGILVKTRLIKKARWISRYSKPISPALDMTT